MKQHKNIFIAIFIFFSIIIIGGLYIREFEKHHQMKHRNDILEISASHAYTIERQLSQSLSATYALATLIQIYGKIDNFDVLAESMIQRYSGISSLQLAPDGIVQQIYPLEGNEKAIGHNLLLDPARRTEALKTIETKKLTLAGPYHLVQGGTAIIGRLPVFVVDQTNQEKFWGFSIVLIRLNKLLEETNIHSLVASGYQYELFRRDPDSGERNIFSRSDSVDFDSPPVAFSFNVPNGEWTLEIYPHPDDSNTSRLYISALTVLSIATLISILFFSLLLRTDEIKSKSVALELSNHELKKMLAEIKTLRGIIPICSFCKNVRDDEGYWKQVEVYLKENSDANFSHGVCPTCFKEQYPNEYAELELEKARGKQKDKPGSHAT
jgi:sensor domain CHASE-containing protein